MSIREDLKAYLDGQLPAQRAKEVEEALAADPALRAEADALRAISATFRLAQMAAPSVGMEQTLAALDRAAKTPLTPHIRPLYGAIGGLAAAAVLIVAILNLYPTHRDSATAMALAEKMTAAPEAAAPAPTIRPDVQVEGVIPQGRAGAMPRSKRVPSRRSGPQSATPSSHYRAQMPATNSTAVERPATASAAASPSDGGARAMEPATAKQPDNAPSVVALASTNRGVKSAKPAAAAERLIVMNGNLGIYVSNVAAAKSQAEGITKAAGGYVESSDIGGDNPESRVASLTLRVPAVSFQSAMKSLRALGAVSEDSSNGQDVTGQVADTEARIKTMKAQEEQYREIMKKARRVVDVLEVKDRADSVQQDIEGLEATDKALRSQVEMSTITVTLSAKPKPAKPAVGSVETPWLNGTLLGAGQSFLAVGKALATVLIYILFFVPIWLPALLLSLWGYKVSRPEYRY